MCCSTNCRNSASHGKMFCEPCSEQLSKQVNQQIKGASVTPVPVQAKQGEDHGRRGSDTPMSYRYPKYYKPVPAGVTEIDTYMLCEMFQVQDHSGAIHHAIKKLLLPGVRTGGKTRLDDVKEARDTLTRWIEVQKLMKRS